MTSVTTADALDWLRLPEVIGRGAIFTSPPDASEIGSQPDEYAAWLRPALHRCFVASTGPTVLVLTDRKHGGEWLSKPELALAEARNHGLPLLWHRIALRRPVGKVDLHVPTYAHVLALGPGRVGRARPDVFDAGKPSWAHGHGPVLAWYVADWLREVGVRTVVDPFCGTGAFLHAAEAQGMAAIGCDIDAARADIARGAAA